MADSYVLQDDIFVPPTAVVHREEEYDSQGFELLSAMQHRHFWYRGRHRFLLWDVHHHIGRPASPCRVVDLGGGCGGWLDYLLREKQFPTSEVALADSSVKALRVAAASLPAEVARYQVDLLALHWRDRWDLAFLLDVLEHIPEDEAALRQVQEALAPGGLLFVTTPALACFWTWNDELVGHQRRYCRADFGRLAETCGLRLLEARYFMFLLSPLLLASRLLRRPPIKELSPEQKWRLLEKSHKVPHSLINSMFAALFACETPLGHYLPFPWGTSVLAVLQKT